MPVIDGNAIIAENRKRNSQPGSYGLIRDSLTGEKLAEVFGNEAAEANASSFAPRGMGRMMQRGAPSPDIIMQNRQAQDQNMTAPQMLQSQAMPVQGESPIQGNDMSEDDLYEIQKEYMSNADKIKKYLSDTGMSMDEIMQDMNPDVSNDDVRLAMDPTNISNEDDAMRAGLALDALLDSGGFDAEKFYSEGILEQCGAQCQEDRQMGEAQAREYENDMIRNGDQPMIMDDAEFERRYAGLLG